jgi:hypothetical protein
MLAQLLLLCDDNSRSNPSIRRVKMSDTKWYEIREDSGASEIIEAESLEDALDQARDWAADGDYDERVMVSVYVDEIDENGDAIPGEHARDEVEAGPEPKPEATECGDEDSDHDWQTPIELVGGCTENPGVFSTGGTRFDYHEVCARCGMYKHSWSQGAQRNPGDLDEGVEYESADARSLAWVAEQ